jgi:hypothetical protein
LVDGGARVLVVEGGDESTRATTRGRLAALGAGATGRRELGSNIVVLSLSLTRRPA